MQTNYKQINIQIITFGVNSNQIEGLEEFQEELESIYTVECKNEKCVACGGGSELELIINIAQDLYNDAVSGIKWDLVKFALCKLLKGIKKLRVQNEDLTLYITHHLDGFDLQINDAMRQNVSFLDILFHDIENNILFLYSRGYSDITSITMPFIETDDKTNRFTPKVPYEDFDDYWWEVKYHEGNSLLFFNPKTRDVFIPN